ncbi:MAG: hypothetical protein KatS3mg076_3162 [Candidatus Binatia bacterium]|nr:MAG: hypothetical protein KatS3mg076_3162 [Candidatus Binatia bacterium]
MNIEPRDEYMHENTGEENFNESMYFNFYDRDHRLGGFVRIGNRPNEGYAEVTLALYRADGSAVFDYRRPEIPDNRAFDAGGMRFEVVEPFRRLRVRYRGEALDLADPLLLEDPKRAFVESPRTWVSLELDVEGLSPIYGGQAEGDAPDMVFARGHYEQHVRATGTLGVGRSTLPFRGLGLRDHSWGPRSWQSPRFYRWLTCQFDEGFGFMGSQIVTEAGREILSGFVFRDGKNTLVERCEIETRWREPGPYHEEVRALLHTGEGTLEVEGRVLSLLPLRNRRHGRTTRIGEGLTEWRHGKHVGYGLSEYLDQT